MKKLSFFMLFLLSLAALAATRPNILFLYTDDQGPWTIGANGYADAHTPNLDRLFREGANLKNAMVNTPVCSPSRASLMTSRYGSELMITEWIHRRTSGLDPALPVWPRLLQKAGYRTGLIGKWHLGYPDKHYPTNFGFDYFMGMRAGGITPKNPKLEKDKQVKPYKGLTEDIFTDEAIDFITRNQADPFALCVHYRAPHAAWLPVAPEDLAPHKDTDFALPHPDIPDLNVKKLKKALHDYAASVTCIDRNVGRILRTINSLKLRDNTIVIFTSDHGYNVGQHGLWSKGNAQHAYHPPPKQIWPGVPSKQRPNLFDSSLRVPTAVRWPGQIPVATVEQVINNMDWFPTILAMAEVAIPDGTLIHGRNALPILRGETIPWDDSHYAEYDMRVGARVQMRAIRTPKWKLMVDFLNPERVELYDLQNDPDERQNLYPPTSERSTSAYRQLSRQLVHRIAELHEHSEDPDYSITLNIGNNSFGAVSPGKPVGMDRQPFSNNLLKFSGPIGMNGMADLRDNRGEPSGATLSAKPKRFLGADSFSDWDQVFMQQAAEFATPLVIENLPRSLTQAGYSLRLYSSAPAKGALSINDHKQTVALSGGFDGRYVEGRNTLTIPKLKAASLSIQLPAGFALSGLQLIAKE